MIYNFFLPLPAYNYTYRVVDLPRRIASASRFAQLCQKIVPSDSSSTSRLEARGDRTIRITSNAEIPLDGIAGNNRGRSSKNNAARAQPFLRNSHGNPLIEPVSLQVSHKTIPANHDDIFARGREPAA